MKRSLLLLFISTFSTVAGAQIATEQQRHAADSLANLANALRKNGNWQEAVRLGEKEIQDRISQRHYFDDIGNAYLGQSSNYATGYQYEKAIEHATKALEYFNRGQKNKALISAAYNHIASSYYHRNLPGDLPNAITNAELAIKYSDKGTPYINAAILLMNIYSDAGYTEEADKLLKNIVKKGKKAYKDDIVQYATIPTSLAQRFASSNNLPQAINFSETAASFYQAAHDTLNISYAKLLMSTGTFYSSLEQYKKAAEILERSKEIFIKTTGKSGPDYIQCLGHLSSVYSSMGDLNKAADITTGIESSIDTITNGNHTTISSAIALLNQSKVYAASGNYQQAIEAAASAVGIYQSHMDHEGVANTYSTMAGYYTKVQQPDQAIDLCQKAIKLFTDLGNHKYELALTNNNMALAQHAAGNDDAAIEHAQKAVEGYRAINDTLSTRYSKSLSNLALFYHLKGRDAEAVKYTQRSLEVQQKLLGVQHPDNVLPLYSLATYHCNLGNTSQMQRYYHEAFTLQSNIVRANFAHLSSSGRETYWNTKNYVFNNSAVLACKSSPSDSIIIKDVYNAQLFTKGLLLNSEIDFKTLLTRSSDATLLEKYKRLADMSQNIETCYTSQSVGGAAKADSLVKEYIKLERELIRESKEYGDFTANMSITGAQISQNLKPGEVAMELFEVPTAGDGKTFFAMYLRKGWTTPRLVQLFSTLELEDFRHTFDTQDGTNTNLPKTFTGMLRHGEGINKIFTSEFLGQKVWKELINAWNNDEGLPEVTDVYFSPSGLFHQWGIEYLLVEGNTRFCDKYNVHRLSSTKQLNQRRPVRPITTATIFGGINYDISVAEMKILHDNNFIDYTPTFLANDDTDAYTFITATDTQGSFEVEDLTGINGDTPVRAGVKYLPATLKEAESIGETLLKYNVHTNIVSGFSATEEIVKGLSGQPQSLVHIATHGFSYPEGDKNRTRLDERIGKKWNISQTEAAMNYSGLLFAGAGNIFNKLSSVPNDIENGILTASEISRLDLRGLDLVVLSACQTGLGDISQEGVFGLQRGFKKAGAHTIMMSLWNVNDKATQILMTNFYIALLNGSSRTNALLQAQQKVRDAGYTKPEYWAAFILLDDI